MLLLSCSIHFPTDFFFYPATSGCKLGASFDIRLGQPWVVYEDETRLDQATRKNKISGQGQADGPAFMFGTVRLLCVWKKRHPHRENKIDIRDSLCSHTNRFVFGRAAIDELLLPLYISAASVWWSLS